MARRKRISKDATAKAEQAQQAEKALKAHLEQLGLETVTEYKVWCRAHGFSRGTNKTAEQRSRERLVTVRQAVDARRTAVRRQYRNAREGIADLFRGTLRTQELYDPRLKSLQRLLITVRHDRRAKQALERLVLHVQSSTQLFDVQTAIPHLGQQNGNTFIDALAALAIHWPAWHRDAEAWKPRSHNARRQFASLIRHLLAEYDAPPFMDSVWFLGTSPQAQQQQRWFIHIARGKNIRTAELPIPYTKRMAHHFQSAPKDCTAMAALRWGQIHGLGGDARLADAIRGTRLGEDFTNDDFWLTVLRFFVAHPMLDPVHVGPIIDFLHHQRYECRDVFVAAGVMERQGPAQPHLSMKGRTPESLLRQVQRWHRQIAKQADNGLQWAASGIGGFEFIEGSRESGNMRRWTIQELLSARTLNDEGRAMHHCVGSYAGSCARRRTSIWSMAVESFEGRRRIVTIEVQLANRSVCQARGRLNERPGEKARSIMQRWATQEGLAIANYV